MKILKNCLFCIRTILRYVPGYALAAFCCEILTTPFAGLQTLMLQRIVDSALTYARGLGETEDVFRHGICLVLLLTLGASLQRIGLYLMQIVSVRLMERMAPDIAGRMTQLEYASFENRQMQELFTKMSQEPETGVYNCALNFLFILQKTLTLLFSMAVIFTISPWIGLGIVLVGIPMLLLGYYAAGRNFAVTFEGADSRRRMAELKRLATDKHAMFERKLFGAEQLFAQKWDFYSARYADIAIEEQKRGMYADVAARLLNVVYLVFVICAAASGFWGGSLSIGQFAAALHAVAGIGNNLHDCSRQMVWLLSVAMEINYYREFLALPVRTDLGHVESLSGYDIAFSHVSFRYPGTKREVLKDVSFTLREGERIAFVGENGAGKSTIVKLLCGLYEPKAGRISVGGVPVRALSPALRTRIFSAVFQDFGAYQLTLRENVAFGNLKSFQEDERLLAALGRADAKELATGHPEGLDRSLGKLTENGQDLSRGQWQKLAMARAFVSDAKYVILDEPTASLDPLAESRMYENFARIFEERGTVMISHRLASAKMADRIFVLDGGRIVQEGSHEELMARQGLYRAMFLVQSSLYREGGEQG